jgi:hypothetical protein
VLDRRLYYGWKAHRKHNRKFVRLEDIVDVRPGLGVHVERRPAALQPALPGPDGAAFSESPPAGAVLDDYCFHVVSLDRSAGADGASNTNSADGAAAATTTPEPNAPPQLHELNLQAGSFDHRQRWVEGLRLVARMARAKADRRAARAAAATAASGFA